MMSYAAVPAASFQGFVPWHALQVETDEVYVWRGVVSGIDILSISDAQAIALAMGKASKGLNIYLPLVPLLFSLRASRCSRSHPTVTASMRRLRLLAARFFLRVGRQLRRWVKSWPRSCGSAGPR